MVLAREGTVTVPIGSGVWVEDEEQVWALAEVVRRESATLITARNMETGKELQIDLVRVIMIVMQVACLRGRNARRAHKGNS